jgi:hypothetical protein
VREQGRYIPRRRKDTKNAEKVDHDMWVEQKHRWTESLVGQAKEWGLYTTTTGNP